MVERLGIVFFEVKTNFIHQETVSIQDLNRDLTKNISNTCAFPRAFPVQSKDPESCGLVCCPTQNLFSNVN